VADSKIEWTDKVWNPVRGCSRVSEGCRSCYAERQSARFSGPGQYAEGFVRDGKWTGRVELVPEALDKPLRWRKPARVFVNSMSDLFHGALPFEEIDQVFAVMALAQRHTFQVLTKRPARMRDYFKGGWCWRVIDAKKPLDPTHRPGRGGSLDTCNGSLRNVWLGVSVEDQASAGERIPILLDTPAAVRFVSYEPALGPVDFSRLIGGGQRLHLACDVRGMLRNRSFSSILDDQGNELPRERAEAHLQTLADNGVKLVRTGGCDNFDPQTGCRGHRYPKLDWLIVGGESGPGARPCNIKWIRSAVEQCKAAGVPVFVKQLGARPVCSTEAAEVAAGIYPTDRGPAGRRAEPWVMRHPKGGDPSEWPEDLRVREFPAEARRG
jgi:protein gp37